MQGFHVVVIELAKNRSGLELSCALLSMKPLNNRQHQLRIKTVRILPISGDLVAQDIRAWNQVVIPRSLHESLPALRHNVALDQAIKLILTDLAPEFSTHQIL